MAFQMREEIRVVPSSDLSGIATVTTAGTEVTLGTATNESGFFVKPHPDNTDTVWVMFAGQTKASGFPLNTGEILFLNVTDLAQIYVDADVNGEKVCWIKA